MVASIRFDSVRPLVRYVDDHQAVLDAHLVVLSPPDRPAPRRRTVDVAIEIDGDDGFHDEAVTRVPLEQGRGAVRVELVEPQRWWPAGMGDQSLYTVRLRLIDHDQASDERTLAVGLTSVRRDAALGPGFGRQLLVNGRICEVQNVVVVDRVDENQILPATGESLLLIRDHFAPELLYEAADRAGILLVQAVPVDPQGKPGEALVREIDRLASHPCLAGYFVGHLGQLADRLAKRIQTLDPTRGVFRRFPLEPAA
ncbi:MAG: hypothetical protein AAF288_11385 [Planctomycetota bacterium]